MQRHRLGLFALLPALCSSAGMAQEARPGYLDPQPILEAARQAIGAGLGLWLWGEWGFLIAFDTIRAYCF